MYQIFIDEELFCDSRIDELAVIDPVVVIEANSIGSFKFKIPHTHQYYDAIVERKTIITVFRDDETEPIFAGICISEKQNIWKQKEIVCENDLTFLNDTVQRPTAWKGQTARTLLEAYIKRHNDQCEPYKHYRVGVVTVHDPNDYITCFSNYNTTMKEIKDDLVDDLGGYLRTRHVDGVRYLDYLAESPNTNTQVVRLGENLMDFESNLDTTEIATVIIPLGETLEEQVISGLDARLTIESVNSGKDYLESTEATQRFGRIEKVVTWDGVTQASNLKAKGQKYLNEIQFSNVYIQAKVIDLHYDNKAVEPFKLLDTVRVISKPHGLDKNFVITKLTLNLNKPEKDTFTLGKKEKQGFAAKVSRENTEIKKKVDSIVPPSQILESARDNATALITAAQNGFVTMVTDKDGHPTELLIMDTNDKTTATKVWRWNVNGLGYSNSGYNGTYGTAVTMDGSIVADRVTTGTMSGDRVRGGTFEVGGTGYGKNGSIIVKDANGNTLITLNKSGLTLSNGQKIRYADLSGTPTIPGDISDLTDNQSKIPHDISELTDIENVLPHDIADLTDNSSKLWTTTIAETWIQTAAVFAQYLKAGKVETVSGTNKVVIDNGSLKVYKNNIEKMSLDQFDLNNMGGVMFSALDAAKWLGLGTHDSSGYHTKLLVNNGYTTDGYSDQIYIFGGLQMQGHVNITGSNRLYWFSKGVTEAGTQVYSMGLYTDSTYGHVVGTDAAFYTEKTYLQASDRRLKHDIEYLDYDAYDLVFDAIEPTNYVLNSGNKKTYGFIAQDVESALDKIGVSVEDITMVSERGEEHMKALDYNQMLPILWAEVKKLKKEIKEIKEGECK